ncbi:protein ACCUMULATION AND REPLICATION OF CHLOROPLASTS 3-like [Hibiscus syriacus]|uniref:protein ACCUMULATION AND REPLICATION OF CHLOROPLASTS 3-like n=1 Tax=Hibiscus syriacus TaxID=106335 RepID=UPI00192357F3|nr:protein ACCUMULATION AND REPLICATION OF CHLOROPLASTS 3-like [Hibiscus syriacus]
MPASSMSFPIFTGSRLISRISLSVHFSSNPVFFNPFFGPKSLCCKRLSYNPKSLVKISMSLEKQSSSLNGYDQNTEGNSGVLDVIAIGSRKDALLEFCLDSPFQSSSLRFWTVLMKEASNVQLQQRVLGKGFILS